MTNYIKALLIITFLLPKEVILASHTTGYLTFISNVADITTAGLLLFFILSIFLYIYAKRQRSAISVYKQEAESVKTISNSVFQNIHSYILLVDKNLIVQQTNYYSLTSADDLGEKKRIGELLRCINALEANGCGRSKHCPHCLINKVVCSSFQEKKNFKNLKATLTISISDTFSTQCDVLISGSYITLDKQEYLLLTVFDVTRQKRVREDAEKNKAQFTVTFNMLPVAIALCNIEGEIYEVNNYYLETMGTTREYISNNSVNIFNNPCISDSIKNRMKQGEYISEEVTYDYQELNRIGYFKSIHSNRQYYRIIVDYMRDGSGQIEKYIIIWVNNTLIHNTLKQNKNIMNMFSFASTASKIGFSSINLLKDESIVTPEFFSNLGEDKETNIKNIINQYSHVHPDDRPNLLEYSKKVLEEKTSDFTFDADIRVEDKTGDWKWVRQVLIQKLFDPENKNIELLGMNIDITRQKETEEKLRAAQQQAENSDKLKSVFLSNMSHEIRTPLNAIVGFSGLLAEADSEEEKQSYIDIIDNNNQLLLQLINDILDLSKIEANTLEFHYTNVNINSLFKDIEQTTKMKAGENNPVEIIFEPAFPYCFIYTERNRLSQVINNFLSNALKFTTEGSIRFGYQKREKGLYFYVSDTGTGIPEEKHEQMFERFVKLDRFKTGTGLGLAICKSIITKLGGEIGVNSILGQGSTFWFTLPIEPTEVPDAETEEKETDIKTVKEDNGNNIAETEQKTAKHTLLIAEDMEDNYKLYQILLGKKYNLIHAWDGQEAIELFVEHQPEAILMDIKMPILDGYEATEAIRQISSDIPIIGVTAFAFSEDKEKILSSGFNMCITKPIIPKTLSDALSSIGL